MNRNKVVLGLQWGDEGKGKVIDVLAGHFDLVVRCQGGANAGHTVVVEGRKTVLHLLPSGALHPAVTCVIGNGVVIDPLALQNELADLGPAGDDLRPRLRISDRAHLVLPCHKIIDRVAEELKGDNKVGTTQRGIGPCYSDKINRIGLRCGELIDEALFEKRLRILLAAADRQLAQIGDERLDIEAILAETLPPCRAMAPMVTDTVDFLHRQGRAKSVLFKGAQGSMLDIDFVTYPFVTSSNTGIGGVITGSGLSHQDVGEVIGIVKAYTTRVGAGPMPTELTNADGEALRTTGGEFGATTGRPRRCGWLDLVVVGYACRINGVDTIALTKLDVLSGRSELPVCVAYTVAGRRIETIPGRIEDLEGAEPVYETLPGWSEDLSSCRHFNDLPEAARRYVAFIEERVGVRVGWIGVGPGRDEVICR